MPRSILNHVPPGGRWVLVTLLLIPAGSGFARAGDAVDSDLDLEGTRRAGPFHFRPFLEFKNVGYDDNIFYQPIDPIGDTTATVGGGLRTVIPSGDHGGLLFDQRVEYVAFGTHSEQNYFNGFSRIKGSWWTAHTLVSLDHRLASTQGRPTPEIDRRTRLDTSGVRGRLRSLSLGRLQAGIDFSHERFDYPDLDPASAVTARQLNRDEDAIALVGEVEIRPRTALLLEERLERVDFSQRPASETRARTFLGGFRLDPGARIQGKIVAGPIDLTVPDRPDLDYSGMVGEGWISSRLGSASRVRFRFLRDVEFSILQDNLYFFLDRWSAAYERFFSRRLSVELLYGRGTLDYPEPIVREGPFPFDGYRRDRLADAQVEFRYRWKADTLLTVRAARQSRESTDAINDMDNGLIAVGTRIDF